MRNYTLTVRRNGRTRQVYRGPVEREVLAGEKSVQVRPFGHLFWVDGRVTDEYGAPISGASCEFEVSR